MKDKIEQYVQKLEARQLEYKKQKEMYIEESNAEMAFGYLEKATELKRVLDELKELLIS